MFVWQQTESRFSCVVPLGATHFFVPEKCVVRIRMKERIEGMKKIVTLIIVLSMVFVLCGCGKSESTKKAEELIDDIGEVSLDSGNSISAARYFFDQLSAKEKKKVANRKELEKAENEYDYLCSHQYDMAIDMATKGYYNAASSLFEEIFDFKDSQYQWEKCKNAERFTKTNDYKFICETIKSKGPENWSVSFTHVDNAVVLMCNMSKDELPGDSQKEHDAWNNLLSGYINISLATKDLIAKAGFSEIAGIVRVCNITDNVIVWECKDGKVIKEYLG